MRHRRGVTLLEVLVTLFIMGVGLLALLVLFPLGALNMAQALRSDRVTTAAGIASEQAIALDLRRDPLIAPAFTTFPGQNLPPNYTGPSYPVMVDPYYFTLGNTALAPGIPRRTTSIVGANVSLANRWFSLHDDLGFQDNGLPKNPVEKGGRYTWAYLLRRPHIYSDAVVDLWAIMYSGRDTQLLGGETAYAAVGTAKTSTVTVTYVPPDKPALRKGTWILDVTAPAGPGGTTYPPNAHFYRVATVTDGSAGQIVLEVEPALKADITQQVVVLENVVEVMEKTSAWLP